MWIWETEFEWSFFRKFRFEAGAINFVQTYLCTDMQKQASQKVTVNFTKT